MIAITREFGAVRMGGRANGSTARCLRMLHPYSVLLPTQHHPLRCLIAENTSNSPNQPSKPNSPTAQNKTWNLTLNSKQSTSSTAPSRPSHQAHQSSSKTVSTITLPTSSKSVANSSPRHRHRISRRNRFSRRGGRGCRRMRATGMGFMGMRRRGLRLSRRGMLLLGRYSTFPDCMFMAVVFQVVALLCAYVGGFGDCEAVG
jgi:hypothetical protein